MTHWVHLKSATSTRQNVMDLVAFALCEMHRGREAVCKSRKMLLHGPAEQTTDAKAIKEHSMRTRGECLSANVNAVVHGRRIEIIR